MAHPSGAVDVRATDMVIQEDALTVTFSGSGPASMKIAGSNLDLSDYLETGVMSFRLNLESLSADELRLYLGDRSINLASALAAQVGQGWTDVSVAVACFADNAEELRSVDMPFALASEAAVSVSIGELSYHKQGEATIGCD